MLRKLQSLGLAAVLAASAISVPSAAEARDRYHDRDDDAAIAIGAGLIGLAIGAAIVSDNDDRYYYRSRQYDRVYPEPYYYPDRYSYRDYPNRNYYYYDRYPRRYYRDYRRNYSYRNDNRRYERRYDKHRRWRD